MKAKILFKGGAIISFLMLYSYPLQSGKFFNNKLPIESVYPRYLDAVFSLPGLQTPSMYC